MVKFCNKCNSMMMKTANNGTIKFICVCGVSADGEAADYVMKKTHSSRDDVEKFKIMIENSPFDLAGQKVSVSCPKCAMPYRTLVMVGTNKQIMLTCECGFMDN